MKISRFLKMFWYILLILPEESSAIPEYSVRLRGGTTPFEGHVEVLVEDEWGAILDTQWDLNDATVICRQLGFSAAKNFTVGSYFEPAHPATATHLQNVACTGSEKSLSECRYENVSSPHGQHHTSNAGVMCTAGHSLRLTGGNIPSRGRLQVYLSDREIWGSVCYDSDSWTTQDSLVVCRQLGHDRVVSTTGVASDSTEFVNINSNCSGQEFNLQSCGNYLASLAGSCSAQLINIECEGSPSTPNSPQVTHSDCQSISINWNPPRSNGGHSVSSYVLRYRPIPSISSMDYTPWQMATLDETETDTTLTSLLPGAIYLLSVAASNQIGTSPFSESAVALTNPPDMSSPEDLTILETGSNSVTLGWTVPSTCGIRVSYYELTYYSLINPGLQYTNRALSFTVISSIVNHTVFLLTPYSTYTITVRAFGYKASFMGVNITQASASQGEVTQPFISAYSSPVMFQTQEAPPNAPPASFSAFLRSSVHFTWGFVPRHLTNGIITKYIITCWHSSIPETVNIPSTTLEYNMTVEGDTQYNCSIAAATQAGRGPLSAPILFFTPPNLNVLPSAPRNVVFAIVPEHKSNSRQEIIVQAQWNLYNCINNYSCIEVLGYIAVCQDGTGNEIRKLVWQYEFENDSDEVASTNLSTRPYTQYRCMMASLNRYGIGSFGSIDSVDTPPLAPLLSPTEIYVTDIQPRHVRLHWTYIEEPPIGLLVGFNIRIYYQDPQDPDGIDRMQNPIPYWYTVQHAGSSIPTKFVEVIDSLLPATDYIVNISAVVEEGGEGPGARGRFTTSRRVLTAAPSELGYSTINFNQPYLFRFTWKMEQPNAISRSMIHSGFTLSCTIDTVDMSEALFTPGQTIINSSLFTSAVQDSYSLSVYMPTNCESTVKFYACSVLAFNEEGVGPSSENVSATLPCNLERNALSGSVLTHPYFSLSLLGILVLVCIGSLICCLVVFLCCRRRRRNITDVEKLYSTVGEMYDENYIRMAPSDSSIKRNWSLTRNHSFNNQRIAPPLPSNRASTALDSHISVEGVNMENPYDEIPGGRNKRQGNNPYAEIAFNSGRRARDSGVRLSSERTTTPSRPDSHSTRPRTLTPQHSSRTSPNVSSQRTSMVQEEIPPGSRMNMRRESPYTSEENSEEGTCAELHASPSNITNLSGNDYVEVTANGELRSLKKGGNSSSSLPGTKPRAPTGAGVVLEETDHHYDNLAAQDKASRSTHHYDNLVGTREGTEVSGRLEGGSGREVEKMKSACGATSESNDFLEFFDNMEAKKGSLQSLTSENDPSYVAMGYQSGSAKDVTEDSQ